MPVTADGTLDLDGDGGRRVRRAGSPSSAIRTIRPAASTRTAAVTEFVTEFRAAAPDGYVLVDEAYIDYVTDASYATAIPLTQTDPRVLVSRTFSKIHGMAGLRVGYVDRPSRRARRSSARRRARARCRASAPAAALASFEDQAHLDQAARAQPRGAGVHARRRSSTPATRCCPSEGELRHGRRQASRVDRVYQQMCREAGVAIARPFPPLTNYARITIGTMDEMRKAVAVMMPAALGAVGGDDSQVRATALLSKTSHGRVRRTVRGATESRREHAPDAAFLERIGQAGGGVAVHRRDARPGTCRREPRRAWRPPNGRAPAGTRVIILGAGLAGLAAAYELRKLGYQCEVLEARARTGGRCFTVRRGSSAKRPARRRRRRRSIRSSTSTPARRASRITTPRRSTTAASSASPSSRSAASTRPRTSTIAARPRARSVCALRELRADWRGYTSELLAKAVATRCARPADDARTIAIASSSGCGTRADCRPRCATPARRARLHVGARRRHRARRRRPIRSALDDLLADRLRTYLATEFAHADADVPDRRRHRPHARRRWPRRVGTSRSAPRSGDRAAGGRRARALYDRRRRAREVDGRLLHLDAAAAGPARRSSSTPPGAAGGDRGHQLLERGQDRAAVLAAFLGGGRRHLRRHHPNQSRHHADPLSVDRLSREEGRARRLLPERRRAPTDGRAARPRSGCSARSTRGRQIHPQYTSAFENAFSIAWQKVGVLEGRVGAVHAKRSGRAST